MTMRRLDDRRLESSRLGGALIAAVSLALLGSGSPAASQDGAPFDLEGAWLVVAHFTDESTKNYEAMRWVDEAWVFEKKGSRLQWSRYPLVVFEDTTGRFEARGRNSRSRVLAAWEPNDRQLAEIMHGPRVNSRGSKKKSLKGSTQQGWRSTGRMQTTSAMVMGYQETWEVTGLDSMPRFSLSDTVGNAAGGGGDEGRTTYQLTSLGERPSGTYERDGIRHGTFFMIRTPPLRGLARKEGTPNERAWKRQKEQLIEEYRQQQRREQGGEDPGDENRGAED